MSASPLEALTKRVAELEAAQRASALDRARIKAIVTQLVLAVWALRTNSNGTPTGALSEDAIRACIAAAEWLDIPLAA